MSNLSDNDLEELFEKWYDTKAQLSTLEKKCDVYKRTIARVLDARNTNAIRGRYFKVSKRTINKPQLLKKNVPRDIWQRYASNLQYDSYYISKNRN